MPSSILGIKGRHSQQTGFTDCNCLIALWDEMAVSISSIIIHSFFYIKRLFGSPPHIFDMAHIVHAVSQILHFYTSPSPVLKLNHPFNHSPHLHNAMSDSMKYDPVHESPETPKKEGSPDRPKTTVPAAIDQPQDSASQEEGRRAAVASRHPV